MKHLAAWVFVVSLLSSPCRAERPEAPPGSATVPTPTSAIKPDPKVDKIYLLDQANKNFKAVDKIDQPERVYLKKTKMDGVYQQFLTGKSGRLTVPEKILLSGSVLRGDRIGGSKERFYFLTREGNWRRTEGPEVYYVQTDDSERRESIITPADEGKGTPQVVQTTPPTHK